MDLSEIKQLPKTDHTPAELDETSRILLNAANLIEERGHCKGAAQVGDAFCLSGAISRAALDSFQEGSDWSLWRGHEEAMARLRTHMECPVAWNDRPERTKEEVVAKLRAVALGL